MNSKYLAVAVTVLAAIAAALAPLPYGWSRIAATSLAAAVASLSPLNTLAVKLRANTTISNQSGNTKLPKKVGRNLLTGPAT